MALAKQHLQEDDSLLIESDLIYDDGIFDLLINNPHPNLALVAKYETWMDGTMVRIDEDNNIVNFVPKEAFKYSDIKDYYKTVNIYKFSKEFAEKNMSLFLKLIQKPWVTMNIMRMFFVSYLLSIVMIKSIAYNQRKMV